MNNATNDATQFWAREKNRAVRARWGLCGRSDQRWFVLTQKRTIRNAASLAQYVREAGAGGEKADQVVPVIDHWHVDAKASGTMMMVMIGRTLFVMRVAGNIMMMLLFVRGDCKIAGIGRKGSAVHADEHAENHNDLEKDTHVAAPKIAGRGCGSRHFGPGPFLDMIRHRGLVEACLLLVAMARCGRC